MKPSKIVLVVATALAALSLSLNSSATARSRTPGETVVNDASQRLAAGVDHTCQVNDDGTVQCWGDNSNGQLGNGSTIDSIAPVAVSGLGNVVAITAGKLHTCALIANGSARCWGDNFSGQLGDGSRINRLIPVSGVSGLTNAVAIVAGHFHTCALLADGTARCWGWNDRGRLGDGTTTDRISPVPVTGLTNAVALAAGNAHTCAILADGGARCWGYNFFGQLGDGSFRTDQHTPAPVSGLTNAVAIAAGFSHTCAILADGNARCWGDNFAGQLGTTSNNTNSIFRTPVAVSGLANAVAINAGNNHTCAVLANGNARCWGFNFNGQLGDGTTTTQRTPTSVRNLSNAVAIAGGRVHTCALIPDGGVRCWGNHSTGQVALLPRGGITARDIAAGRSHTCAVRANATVSCWGLNSSGQLGDGTNTSRTMPMAVPGLGNVVAIAAGKFHSCALLANGTARCWGLNASGQLGDGSAISRATPVAVSGLANVVAIAAGDDHTCGLLANGSEFCWGLNGTGQLGNGSNAIRPIPTLVAGTNSGKTTAIAAGGSHSCLTVATPTLLDSKAMCWGKGTNGQLGNSGSANHSTADSTALGLLNAVAIAAGNSHSCAVLADGAGRCWGANATGAIGNNTTIQQLSPVPVFGLTNAVSIGAGDLHSCAVTAAGTARCWGANSAGQLGDGTTIQRLVPVIPTTAALTQIAVRGGNPIFNFTTQSVGNIVQIANGANHTCAIIANGAVRCWGENTFGQLGINSTVNHLRPVLLPSFTLNIDPLVLLSRTSRVATAQIIATCEKRQRLRVHVTITQGPVFGKGTAVGKCTGAVERYPVTLQTRGRHGYVEGPAKVDASAVIEKRGRAVDTQKWSRTVTIDSTPRMVRVED